MDESAAENIHPVEPPVHVPVAESVEHSEAPVVAPVEGEAGDEERVKFGENFVVDLEAIPSTRDGDTTTEPTGSQFGEAYGEDTEELMRQRKLQKREQKRLAQNKIDKHLRGYKSREPSIVEVEEEEEQEPEIIESKRKSPEEPEAKSDILDDEEFKTGISSDEEFTPYLKEEPGSSFKDDFMANFIFPSLSDISTPSSDHPLNKYSSITQVSSGKETLSTKIPSTSFGDEHFKFEEENDGDDDAESSSTTSSISSWPCPLDAFVKVEEVQKEVEDDGMDMFLEMHAPEGKVFEESTNEIEAARRARENYEIVNTFLMNTIDQAVNTALYMGPGKEFAAKVDNMKLYEILYEAVDNFLITKQLNRDLNMKMAEYYRRVGQHRCYDTLPPKQARMEHDRYKQLLYKLDYLKERAVQTKITYATLMCSVNMDIRYCHSMYSAADDSLDNCVRKTLNRKDADHLARTVEIELRRMRALRNEISDSRIWLITRQHSLGRILERKHNFDQITPDLTMDQFLATQNDVTALYTKVEERGHDLCRMRDRCTKHMHQLAFIREKTSILWDNLTVGREQLEEKTARRDQLRDKLYKLKLKHEDLKIQKTFMHEKCGLLFKPTLLYDYDDTMDLVIEGRQKVAQHRHTIKELEKRIANYLKRLS